MRKLILGLLALISISSCSTKKNTFLRRAYHNLTSHYNVYWNGNESLKEGVKTLSTTIKDDYNNVLAVYNYGTLQEAQSIYPNMDRATEKASICIQKHSIYKNRKEHVKWIDDCYMLIGKSYFYKQEYIAARRTFTFVQTEFRGKMIATDASLWLAKTYIEMEQYDRAVAVLNNLLASKKDNKFSDYVRDNIDLVYADLFIKEKKYDDAIPYLYKGLKVADNKDLKSRVHFILGQIYQKDENYSKATEEYLATIKKNPVYAMEFQARINMAQTYESGMNNSSNLTKGLFKMLREAKNENFKDQIYYALAEVEFENQKDSLGIDYLRQSVATSKDNAYQKTRSSLELADIYFNKSEYPLSQAYYDTAVQSMPQKYPNEEIIKNKAKVLSELIADIETIKTQDSLQMVAKLPKEEQEKFIDDLIADYEAEEAKKSQDQWTNTTNNLNQQGPNFSSTKNEGKWYFYNPEILSYGLSEFKKKFGNRKLEDLWRLSDKSGGTFQFSETEANPADTALMSSLPDSVAQLASNPKNREYYLVKLPDTPEKIKISDSLLVESYNNLGYLYKEGLKDNPNAVKTYEEFLEKFPDNKYKLATYYSLYKTYTDLNNQEKADYYKNLILNQYPDSDYAMIITDPDAFIKMKQSASAAEMLYKKAYAAYSKEQYYRVINFADQANELYPTDTAVLPKFDYLKALSTGQVDIQDSMTMQLKKLVKTYPQAQVSTLANNILQYSGEEPVAIEGSEETEENFLENSPFKYNKNAQYLFVVSVPTSSSNLNALKIKLSDFNKKYYKQLSLSIKSLLLDDKNTLITVSIFKNEDSALNYLSNVENNEYVFSAFEKEAYQTFIISTTNYPALYRDKDIDEYIKFYNMVINK
ncbi:MAG: tetratricopeptide repeat protein [Hyphomicrobiales bacterium]